MADESIPLALACTLRLARRTSEGDVIPFSEDDAPSWASSRAVLLRATDVEGPLLVELIDVDASPEPFHADYDAGIVSTPSGDYDLMEFQKGYLRCDEQGKVIGNFIDPSWMQMRDAQAAACEPNIADVAAMVEARRRGELVADQIDWRMFDIAMSDETDGLTAEEALERSRFHNEAPLHHVHGLEGLVSIRMEAPEIEEGDAVVLGEAVPVPDLVLEGWQEIRMFPQYLIDGVRVLFRRFLAERIGETPIEEIVRIQLGPGEMQAICEVFEQEGFEDMGISRPFADDRVMRGGYTTSEVRNFRGNGVDVIVFEDFAGSYAYAWPEQIRRKEEKKNWTAPLDSPLR